MVFHKSLFPSHTIPTQLFGAAVLFVFNKVVRTPAEMRGIGARWWCCCCQGGSLSPFMLVKTSCGWNLKAVFGFQHKLWKDLSMEEYPRHTDCTYYRFHFNAIGRFGNVSLYPGPLCWPHRSRSLTLHGRCIHVCSRPSVLLRLILSRPTRPITAQLSPDWLVPIVRVFLQAPSYNGVWQERVEPGARDTSVSSLSLEMVSEGSVRTLNGNLHLGTAWTNLFPGLCSPGENGSIKTYFI